MVSFEELQESMMETQENAMNAGRPSQVYVNGKASNINIGDYSNEEDFQMAMIAESLGQGITRQGGNY